MKAGLNSEFYIAGQSSSTDLTQPQGGSTGVYQQGNGSAFVGEFFKSNGHPKWITKIGGTGGGTSSLTGLGTQIGGIDIDNVDGRLYLVGRTSTHSTTTGCSAPTSNTFPLCDAGGGRYYQSAFDTGIGGYVMELNTANNSLVWSTLLGKDLYLRAVKKYNSGGVKKLYIAGPTENQFYYTPFTSPATSPGALSRLPFVNPGGGAYWQGNFVVNSSGDNVEGFVGAFNSDFKLEWATWFGGNKRDAITSIATTPDGDLVIAGSTTTTQAASSSTTANFSGAFPLYHDPSAPDFFQGTHGTVAANLPASFYHSGDYFIARFGVSTYNLKWSTYFGDAGNQGTSAYGQPLNELPAIVKTDALGNIFLAGTAEKTDASTTIYTPRLPVLSLGGLYYQDRNASDVPPNPSAPNQAEAFRGNDAFFAAFGSFNQPRWVTYFGGNGANGTGPNRADEFFHDLAVLSGQRAYGAMTSRSFNTPYECPPAGPTGQPYCDATYDGAGDFFLTAFEYQLYSNSIADKTSRSDAFHLVASPNPTEGQALI